MSSVDAAFKIADAVLYEGYVLYPYRASALKNRFRWQFGIVAPRAWSEEGGEPWQMRTECLIEPLAFPVVHIAVRFLQIQEGHAEDASWEEGVERRIEIPAVALQDCLKNPKVVPFDIPADGACIGGSICISAEALDGLLKLRVLIGNESDVAANCDRSTAMRRSLVGTHILLTVNGGAFVSLIDPPERARGAAQSCSNLHTWPVLVGSPGERQTMLSAPIILPEYPQIAPESPGDFYDGTEIDELLTLRVMTLTDEEKHEACATDERARKIVERSASIPHEIFERLHGALRELPASNVERFFNPPDEDPDKAAADTAAGKVVKGTRVRLSPKRRADSMDMFLAGRTAIVEAVHRDVEDRVYVAVRVEGDQATDVHGLYPRFYYFYPDEIESVEV
jgi:hypothetical protein